MRRYLLSMKYGATIMLVCAIIHLVDLFLPIHLNQYGILPRNTSQLSGIFYAPFLHGDWRHLLSNFFPFVIFSSLIGLQSVRRFWLVFIFSIVSSGGLVWLLGRGDSIHIGMSGVIYAMWGYLIAYGFSRKKLWDIVIAVVVLLVYGGLVLGVLPSEPNISYESHLLGALSGAMLGYYLVRWTR